MLSEARESLIAPFYLPPSVKIIKQPVQSPFAQIKLAFNSKRRSLDENRADTCRRLECERQVGRQRARLSRRVDDRFRTVCRTPLIEST